MEVKFNKGEVVITIPADQKAIDKAEVSGSGKSKILGSTQGFMQVKGAPAGVKLNLNLLWVIPKDQRKAPKEEKASKKSKAKEDTDAPAT